LDAAELSKRIESVNANRRTVDPNVASVERLFELYAGDWMVTSQEGLNTDEFPRVEFLTPISNRNRELLSGGNFEDFYDKRMVDLATDDVSVVGLENPQSTERIRAKQQLVLFGGEE
jgi:spermidine synthase